MASPNNKSKSSKDASGTERQIVCSNRRARHEYDVLDEIDCGIVLTGSEVAAKFASMSRPPRVMDKHSSRWPSSFSEDS